MVRKVPGSGLALPEDDDDMVDYMILSEAQLERYDKLSLSPNEGLITEISTNQNEKQIWCKVNKGGFLSRITRDYNDCIEANWTHVGFSSPQYSI